MIQLFRKFLLLSLIMLSVDVSMGGEPVELKYHLRIGEVYRISQLVVSDLEQKIGGEKTYMSTYLSGDIEFRVIEDQDSCYEIEAQYVFLGLIIKSDDGISSINSDETGSDASMLLGAMKNVPFKLSFFKDGRVRNVRDLDKMIANVFEEGPALTAEDSLTISNLLYESYGADAISTSIENLTAFMPNRAVKKGESWGNEFEVSSGIRLQLKNTYKLSKVYKDSVVISRTAIVNTPSGGFPKLLNKFKVVYSLTGKLNGSMTVNLKTGWIMHSEFEQKMRGNIHFERCPDIPQGYDVPVSITYSSKALDE